MRTAVTYNASQYTLNMAASSGNQILVKWLMHEDRGDMQCRPDHYTLMVASELNNMELAEWLK